MNTPILDFIRDYAASDTVRMHMPGHKGRADDKLFSGIASYDITEIKGADDLFHADGIVGESEKNASELFGCDTYYSTEGSSLCIRAMLYLCRAFSGAEKPYVLAARNVHKTFVSACVLLDLDAEWIAPENGSLISLSITASDVEKALSEVKETHGEFPCCVYLTSPDYLGHILPVKEIAEVCHENGVPLVVDNAHGAYLRFLQPSLHPIDLGADLCCDSAHKTLAALTGTAYMHVHSDILSVTKEDAKNAMVLFASTSPSWLLLSSLDRLNPLLENGFSKALEGTAELVASAKKALVEGGFSLLGEEPLKITLKTKEKGYTGDEFAQYLRTCKTPVEVEFSDPDQIVLMASPNNTKEEIETAVNAVLSIPVKTALAGSHEAPAPADLTSSLPQRAMSMRDAAMSPWETISVDAAEGRTAHLVDCFCPPAIPVVICGERIGKEQIALLKYYGYETCRVVKQ